MAEEKFRRKLTAILSADVAGYSRLMGEDEEATVRTLTAYREMMSTLIQKHQGRVVDSPGDNLLAEFGSVVDAVRCAVEIQEELKARNAELPENRRMVFRIGINLGDVIEEEERIYGDGVNIAARVESLAEGGGICISRTAYDQVKNKLTLGYEYLGEHTVKNITEPVRVYRVLMEPEAAGKVIGEERRKTKQLRGIAIGAVAVLIVVAGVLAIWNFYFRPAFEPSSVEKMAYPLPDKPSIAVLPFKNISGDPEQEFLADGITESIIGTISRVSGLFVIASNSVFTYKGKAVKTQTVSEELGVQNILEGTVQRIGNHLRVNAQLIDALTGQHLWSEKYDREKKDLFLVQDSISKEILTALRVMLVEGEQARVWAKGTTNIEAYLKFLKAYDTFKSFNKKNMILTRQLCEEAIALDANYGAAYSLYGTTHMMDIWWGWYEQSARVSMEKAEVALRKAVDLNPLSDYAWANLGHLYLMQKRHDEAIAAGQKSVALNPNGDYNMVLLAMTYMFCRRAEEAIRMYEEAWRLNPYCPSYYIHAAAVAYRELGKYDEAIETCKRVLQRYPDNFPTLQHMASVYGMAGRLDEGRAVAEQILKLHPGYCVENQWLGHKFESDAEAVRDALRKVGIPEHPPLPLPDKPSIAVLPFVNMSDDPKQEYFSDGITEEIITALCKVPKLFVIARNSTFTYKGKPVKVQQVGRELGVRYVLEGSVRKAGNKVRITAQLVDTKTGHHLWAERYDRELKDIFALQDEITMKIVTAMQVKLTEGEQARLLAKGTKNLEAYLKLLQGLEPHGRGNKEENARAQKFYEEAIALDPEYANSYALLGITHLLDVWYGSSKFPRESFAQAMKLAQKAIAIDASLASAHGLLGYIYTITRKYDMGIAQCERAVAINPNDALAQTWLGHSLYWADRAEEALPVLKKAMRLDPISPSWGLLAVLAMAYRDMGQFEEAISACKTVLKRWPDNFIAHGVLAATYSMSNRNEEARSEAAEMLRINPDFSLERFAKVRPHKNQANTARFVDALRKAGLK